MLAAIGEQGESAAQGVEGISAQALAEGDLQALNDFAGVFSTLCNELLDGGKGDRPPSGSSSAGPRPACTTARPASAIPASICAPAGAAEAELGPTGGEEEAEAIDVTDGACASAHAACAAACSSRWPRRWPTITAWRRPRPSRRSRLASRCRGRPRRAS